MLEWVRNLCYDLSILSGPVQHDSQLHWVMQAPSPWQGCDSWRGMNYSVSNTRFSGITEKLALEFVQSNQKRCHWIFLFVCFSAFLLWQDLNSYVFCLHQNHLPIPTPLHPSYIQHLHQFCVRHWDEFLPLPFLFLWLTSLHHQSD